MEQGNVSKVVYIALLAVFFCSECHESSKALFYKNCINIKIIIILIILIKKYFNIDLLERNFVINTQIKIF